MASIHSLYNNVQSLDIEKIAAQSIDETKEVIADLNAEQLFHGIRSDGADITPYYAESTIAIKKEKGQPYDRVTLKDTGAFYAGIQVKVISNKVIIDSSDAKNDRLFKKYSTVRSNIFGLSPLYKREYLNESLRREFIGNLRKKLGL